MAALSLAIVLLGAACGGDPTPGDGRPADAGGTAAPTSPQPAPAAEPTSCPGGGQLIKAVQIPAMHAAPVHIPASTIGGRTVPAATVPGVDIPAQRIPAQCVEVGQAPGGCLGALAIPATGIPGVTIPAAKVPGVKAPGIDIAPVERPAVTRPPVRREGVTRAEVCQSRPSQSGRYVDAVVRDGLVRDGLVRDGLVRDALVRDAACNDEHECIPTVSVPSVRVPSVSIPGVSIPSSVLKGYRAGQSQVFKGEDQIAFNIEADVLFDFGRADIKPAAAAGLAKVAASIAKEAPAGAAVRVDGHTDAKGAPAPNRKLSEQRAQAIVDWLATKGGIDRSRLKAAGYGETKPVAPNTKPDGSDDPQGRRAAARTAASSSPPCSTDPHVHDPHPRPVLPASGTGGSRGGTSARLLRAVTSLTSVVSSPGGLTGAAPGGRRSAVVRRRASAPGTGA